ncbi:MAG TPA: hypothetical protein VHZ03_38055 [Trebonia sp.]|nr:hypothetical protein [Trebonia sp.]
MAAATVDDAVAGILLDTLTCEQVALALAAADEVAGRHQRASRAAELAVERARYEADRAERALSQVEPENRVVARTLEACWETRLTALAEAEQALQAGRDALPPLPSRAELEKLAADLPGLWHAPATGNKDRNRLLRTLIADVTPGCRGHTAGNITVDLHRVSRCLHRLRPQVGRAARGSSGRPDEQPPGPVEATAQPAVRQACQEAGAPAAASALRGAAGEPGDLGAGRGYQFRVRVRVAGQPPAAVRRLGEQHPGPAGQ